MDLLVCWMCVLFSVPLTGCLEMHLSETLQPGTLVANMSLGPGWTYTMDRTFSSKSIQSLLRVDGNDGAIRLSRKVECAHTLRNPASVYFRTGSSTSGDVILTHFDVFVHGQDCFIKYKRRKESGKPDIHIRQLREMKLTSCLPAGNLLFNLTELLPGFTRSSTFLNSMCAGKELSALIMHGGLFPVSHFCLEHRRQRELGLHCALQSSAGERLSVQLSLTLLKVPQQVGSLSETTQRKSDILFLRAKRQVNTSPQFQLPNYQVSVPENEPAGTRVITLKATDTDDGEAGRLEYSMEALFDRRSNDLFSIDSQTGSITTTQSLDREIKDSYILKITVTDNGSPKKSSFSYLILTVSDTNDHSPVFEKYEYRVSIRENKKPVGSTVVVISATDEDTGENARITYVMEDNVPQFKIDPDTGAITTQIEIDYEDQASYTLAIIARDNGIPQKSDTTYVEIIILDANDNAPQFLRDMYQGTVFEDAPVYTSVLQISASDRDSGLNGRVSYTFQGGDDGEGDFVIHTHSGIIKTARKLDRENVPVYNLKAFAVDRGVPPLKAAVPIHVVVQDINDNAPVFEKDELFIDVEENSPVGSVVARISATDPDEGTNAQIMYQIVEGNIPEVFQLDIFSGDLTALTDLDYETKTEYLIVVQATSAPLVSRATVHIRLVDMNDNRPVLEDFEIIFNNYLTKSNSFPSGIIGKVPAHDPDVSDKLRYKFESGNELSLLLLNEDTGDLRLSRDPENDRPLEAPMIISVTDGLHQVVARCTLRVTTFTGDMAVSQYSSP